MRRHVFVLALLLVYFGSLPALAKDAPWKRFESDHFEIITQDSAKNARKVLEHLEQVRNAYETLTNTAIVRPGKGRVILFRNRTEYDKYSVSGISSAYYLKRGSQDFIVLYSFDAESERTLNHEYFHLFSSHAGFQLPLWLEEGLADYFSTLRVTKKDISVGLPVVTHLQYLNQVSGRLAPLVRIFDMDRKDRSEFDQRATSQLYAQGWALAHMTFLGKNFMPRSQEFFHSIRDGKTTAEAYKDVYGIDPDDLERLLALYVQQRSYSFFKHPGSGLREGTRVEETALKDWEASLALATLLHNVERSEEADRAFEELATRFPDVPEIAEAMGYVALGDLDRETAVQYFRRAATNGSTNPQLYYDLLVHGCDYNHYEQECQQWANTALRYDPTHSRARRWVIGYVLNARKFDHALAYLMRAGTVKASDAPEHFAQIAYASLNLGRIDEARTAIARGLEHATKPDELDRLSRMESFLAAIERQQINQQVAGNLPAGDSNALFAPPSVAQDRVLHPHFESEQRPRVVRGRPEPADEADFDDPQDLVAHFANLEENVLSDATLLEVRCGEQVFLVVEVEGNSLLLRVDDPQGVRVFVKGRPTIDHQFTCGQQPAANVQVGYHISDSDGEDQALLRILNFR